MRKPLPPLSKLNGNGQIAAVKFNYKLSLWNLADGSSKVLSIPHEISTWAVAPNAPLLAVAGEEQLSLFQEGQLLAAVDCPKLHRLSISDEGLVAGVTHFERGENTLYIWQGEALTLLIKESLGSLLTEGLELDGSRKRIALWGKTGAGLLGTTFVQALTFAQDKFEIAWAGKNLPLKQPNGILLPLMDGALGVYDQKKLATINMETGQPAQSYSIGEARAIAVSPNGMYVAWLQEEWKSMPPVGRLRSINLTTGAKTAPAKLDNLGRFPMVAVDDDGQVRLIFGEPPNRVMAFTAISGQVTKLLEAEVAV